MVDGGEWIEKREKRKEKKGKRKEKGEKNAERAAEKFVVNFSILEKEKISQIIEVISKNSSKGKRKKMPE